MYVFLLKQIYTLRIIYSRCEVYTMLLFPMSVQFLVLSNFINDASVTKNSLSTVYYCGKIDWSGESEISEWNIVRDNNISFRGIFHFISAYVTCNWNHTLSFLLIFFWLFYLSSFLLISISLCYCGVVVISFLIQFHSFLPFDLCNIQTLM